MFLIPGGLDDKVLDMARPPGRGIGAGLRGAACPTVCADARQGRHARQSGQSEVFTEWGFAEAVIDGDRVYLSGVVAGLRPGETDQAVAFDRAFKIVGDVLARSGSSWDGVVDMTTYHTDITTQLDSFVAVKHRYVRAPFPAWTAIDVDRLVPDNGLVEIKVVARRKP